MHIAIDVHSLGAKAAGNETYFQQLLRGLVVDPSKHEYSLLYTHDEAPQTNAVDQRFRWIRVAQNRFARMCVSLPRKLRQNAPDIFHCQYARPLFTRSKTVVAIHDLAHEHYPDLAHPIEVAAMRRWVRSTAKQAERVLTLSNFSARDIAQTYGVPADKIAVTHLAASDSFRPRDKGVAQETIARLYGIQAPFLLYVGRIQARKNLLRLLDAYAQMRANGPSPKLVLAGKRDFGFEQLQDKLNTLKLADSVVLPGYIAAADLPFFYNAAELFIFPSLFEGFGLPVLEGMASGVPTITSQGSSLEEVAGDGAVIIDPNDTASIASALESVLSSAELRRDLVARGLRRSAEFTVQKFAAKVLGVYSSVAAHS
jgi:glycosyltransferase involved in cell wall biosynthesis